MYAFRRKYVRLYILTHIQTEINIFLIVLYVIPERDVPVWEYMPLAAMLNLEIGLSRSGISFICL